MPDVVTPTEPVPVVTGEDGVLRIRGTRITLDTIVDAFSEGATAEEIAQQYPSASLADVYQAIGYYLRHSEELNAYFSDRRRLAAKVKAINESKWPSIGIRDRLLARRLV